MDRDSIKNTLIVTGSLCIICSLLVSSAAVGLRSKQQRNQELDQKKNILKICNIDFEADSIEQLFQENIQPRLVDLQTGKYVQQTKIGNLSLLDYDLDKVLQTDARELAEDPAGLGGRRENYAVVFLYPNQNQVILPIRGRGLWSTLWGYISLSADASTTQGIAFYDHGETPGLGGEIDNPQWKKQWRGKQALIGGQVVIQVRKQGQVEHPAYEIDGIAGATVTTQGVHRLIRFWLGQHGFGKYLARPDKFTTSTTLQQSVLPKPAVSRSG